MRYPEFVNKGDVIYVTAPSDGNTEEIDIYRLEKAKDKATEISQNMLEGKIETKNSTACTYCQFSAVCGIKHKEETDNATLD